jgi:antitoxin component of MazEF toxin-antitoxin module
MSKFITTIQQFDDSEDYFIELPDELCQELNWKEDTKIVWDIQDDAIIISEYKETNNWYETKEEAIRQYTDSLKLS